MFTSYRDVPALPFELSVTSVQQPDPAPVNPAFWPTPPGGVHSPGSMPAGWYPGWRPGMPFLVPGRGAGASAPPAPLNPWPAGPHASGVPWLPPPPAPPATIPGDPYMNGNLPPALPIDYYIGPPAPMPDPATAVYELYPSVPIGQPGGPSPEQIAKRKEARAARDAALMAAAKNARNQGGGPSLLGIALLAGAGYVGYKWWTGRKGGG